ncbi:DUF742 domain-containing protein [Pseudonocardia zijingensis]|jgi:hypothetical protein|uniref:DUF742 domain-containing protein n=1 Tax=Pseudonocardia zijingensis TaxID=153376 RepID=A0ABN1P9D7_9PSEU
MSTGRRPRHRARDRLPRRLVPVYVLTGGRTRPGGSELPMESLVTVTERVRWAHDLEDEYRTIIEVARKPVSLVEVGAGLGVPVAVVRVLVGDLVEAGLLDVHAPPPAFADAGPSPAVLTQLLEGLRAR